jgi:hypothetical protein
VRNNEKGPAAENVVCVVEGSSRKDLLAAGKLKSKIKTVGLYYLRQYRQV